MIITQSVLECKQTKASLRDIVFYYNIQYISQTSLQLLHSLSHASSTLQKSAKTRTKGILQTQSSFVIVFFYLTAEDDPVVACMLCCGPPPALRPPP